jgi:hypothetical protein
MGNVIAVNAAEAMARLHHAPRNTRPQLGKGGAAWSVNPTDTTDIQSGTRGPYGAPGFLSREGLRRRK